VKEFKMARYQEKQAVITGGTSGIGLATAKPGPQGVLANRVKIGRCPSWESDTRAILYQIITAGTDLAKERHENRDQENRTGAPFPKGPS
jgi:short-subunit dehydrogenase involved in D-alanine esterification of teichoic acids